MLNKHFYLTGVRQFFDVDDTGGGKGTEDDPDKDLKDRTDLGESGKEAIRKERAAARAAREDAKKAKEERDALLAEKEKAEEAEKKKKEKEVKDAGKFEELAKQYEEERDLAVGEVIVLKDKVKKLQEAVDTILENEWDALPEHVRDVYVGDEDDVLAKLNFLPRARKMMEQFGSTNGSTNRIGNKPGPAGKITGKVQFPTKEEILEEMRGLKGR